MMRFALFALLVSLAAGCGGGDDSPTAPTPPEVTGTAPYSATDITVGTGQTVVVGNRITADYSLWLYSDTAAENKGRAVEAGRAALTIAPGSVIGAWVQGVPGMQVGGRRRIVAPPELAYGANPPSGIPVNATLLFEVAVVSIP